MKQQRNPRKKFKETPRPKQSPLPLWTPPWKNYSTNSDATNLSNGPTLTALHATSDQKPLHTLPLSDAWAYALLSVNLTAIPSASTCRRLSNRLTLPVIRCRTHRPSPPDSNLQNCQICTVVQICPSTLYGNLSSIGTGLTNTITDWRLKRASHRHPLVMDSHMFVVSGLIKPT